MCSERANVLHGVIFDAGSGSAFTTLHVLLIGSHTRTVTAEHKLATYETLVVLPDDMKAFVEAQATRRGFGTVSEYVRSILRAVQDQEISRAEVRTKLQEAFDSGPATPMIQADWDGIRQEVERCHEARQEKAHAPKNAQGR